MQWIEFCKIHSFIELTHFLFKFKQSTGEFQSGVAAKPNELAACQVTPDSEWILSKVIEHDPKSGMYQLADEDIESNKSEYTCFFLCFDIP